MGGGIPMTAWCGWLGTDYGWRHTHDGMVWVVRYRSMGGGIPMTAWCGWLGTDLWVEAYP